MEAEIIGVCQFPISFSKHFSLGSNTSVKGKKKGRKIKLTDGSGNDVRDAKQRGRRKGGGIPSSEAGMGERRDPLRLL